MNHFFTSVITLLQVAAICVASEPLKSPGSRGNGEHFSYQPDQWGGNEQVVTKLLKGAETILFVRTSRGEFEVRKELPKREVFFKFSSTWEAMSPGLRWAIMVDFVQVDDMSAVLMLGDRGYYYLRSSTTPIEVKPPLHFMPLTALKAGNWVPVSSFGPCDFYHPERHGGVEGGIGSVGLNSINEIVFERVAENRGSFKNVFTVKEDHLMKDGLKVEEVAGIPRVNKLSLMDERNFSKILQEGVQDKDIKASLIGYDRDDVLKFISEFSDIELGVKVKQRITAALAE